MFISSLSKSFLKFILLISRGHWPFSLFSLCNLALTISLSFRAHLHEISWENALISSFTLRCPVPGYLWGMHSIFQGFRVSGHNQLTALQEFEYIYSYCCKFNNSTKQRFNTFFIVITLKRECQTAIWCSSLEIIQETWQKMW